MSEFSLIYPNVMIDSETVSTFFDAGMLSIGAVKFDHTGILDRFYVNISLKSIKEFGLHIDPETLRWWAEQKPGAIEALFKNAVSLPEALQRFNDWYGTESLATWSNGCDFDQVIMRTSFRAVSSKERWDYWDGNCYRTLKKLLDGDKSLTPPANEDLHNALADAEWQALHVINMWKAWAGEIDHV